MDENLARHGISNSKLTEDDKISEYINLLLNDSSFEIKSEDQERCFSNGKKIGMFFSDHHQEIVNRFFGPQKHKTSEFKARAKIIDYIVSIGGKKIKRIQESYDLVLAYLSDFNNIEDIIRCVSISMSEDAAKKYKSAMADFMEVYNYTEESEYYLETYMNNSGMSFAMTSEKIFKALILFNEALKSPKYTYAPSNYSDVVANNNGEKKPIVGTTRWRQLLNKKGKYGSIRSESSLLELIQENIVLPTLDKRASISDLKSSSGHDLYSLYQLLDPVSKLIVNSEFYIYDPNNPDNKDKGIGMYAVLTRPMEYQQAGTSGVKQNLSDYSNDFIKARYADIDLNDVKLDELDFLKRMATALKDYCTYKFPIGKKYDSMDFFAIDGSILAETIAVEGPQGIYKRLKYPFFGNLDKVSKFYLLSNFKTEEIDILNEYLKNLSIKGMDLIQIEQFLNLAIFFKQFVIEKMRMELYFAEVVLNNLLKYFDSIKDFDLFKGTSDNLFLNNFFTKENIERLQKEITLTRGKSLIKQGKLFSQTEDATPEEVQIDDFAKMLKMLGDVSETPVHNPRPVYSHSMPGSKISKDVNEYEYTLDLTDDFNKIVNNRKL